MFLLYVWSGFNTVQQGNKDTGSLVFDFGTHCQLLSQILFAIIVNYICCFTNAPVNNPPKSYEHNIGEWDNKLYQIFMQHILRAGI